MLELVWIAILFVAVIFQVIAIFEKSIVLSIFTIMFWLVLMVESVSIQWPYYSQIYNVSSTNITTSSGYLTFSSLGVGMLFLGFIFINIVWTLLQYLNFRGDNLLP